MPPAPAPPAIVARGITKTYTLYARPLARLRSLLWREGRADGQKFHALQDVSFEVRRGEVLGIVGRNGAGKSTLLQIVCGTLQPSSGSIEVHGRVAALLELGAGFHPEFTGRENALMSALLMGASEDEARRRLPEIIAFAGIEEFIDQPVKTYSSGMFVRLAFSVATAFEPEILVIDEALAVGDGEFARRSFERIMQLREQGTTILFCSHALYQVEALCTQAMWLDHGRIAAFGPPTEVTSAYREELAKLARAAEQSPTVTPRNPPPAPGGARILEIAFFVNGQAWEKGTPIHSRKDDFCIRVTFAAAKTLPPPSLAVSFSNAAGELVCGVGNVNDGIAAAVDSSGHGWGEVCFEKLPLLKGRYSINVALACERAIHVYESVIGAAEIEVVQSDLEQGVVHLPHVWRVSAAG